MRIHFSRSILTVAVCVALSISLAGNAVAQSSSWDSEWEKIRKTYDDEGDYERAMRMLDEKLQALGPGFDNTVLADMIGFVKFYFPGVSSDTQLFERVLFNMLRPGRVDRVTGAFADVSALEQSVATVKARWQRPTSAKVTAGVSTLSIGETTRINVTTYNEKRAQVPASGLRYTVSPSGRASWDGERRLVTARAAGKFTVKVARSDGASLGSVSITVGEPRVVARAEFYVDATELEIGQTASYSLVVYDQSDAKIDQPNVTITATPEGAATIDRQSRKITVLEPGKVTINVSKRNGDKLASAEINVPEAVSVSLTPDFQEIEEGGKGEFTIKSNRPMKETGVKWELEKSGVVQASETASDETSVRIEVRSVGVGSTALVVTDGSGKRLARSPINVRKAITLPPGPSSRNLLISAGVTAALGVAYLVLNSDASSKFDTYSDAVTVTNPATDLYGEYEDAYNRANLVGYVAAVAAAGTAYFAYRYFKDQGEYRNRVDELRQSRMNVEISPTHVALHLRF